MTFSHGGESTHVLKFVQICAIYIHPPSLLVHRIYSDAYSRLLKGTLALSSQSRCWISRIQLILWAWAVRDVGWVMRKKGSGPVTAIGRLFHRGLVPHMWHEGCLCRQKKSEFSVGASVCLGLMGSLFLHPS